MDDLIRCDACSHDLAEHDQGLWEKVGASLVCSYIVERSWRAVDDIEDRLCECVVPYWPYEGDRPWTRDGGLAARWHLAKAAALVPEGERRDLEITHHQPHWRTLRAPANPRHEPTP